MRKAVILVTLYLRAVVLFVTFPLTAMKAILGLTGQPSLRKRIPFLLSELNLITQLLLRGVAFSRLVYRMQTGRLTSWRVEPPYRKLMTLINPGPGTKLRVLNFGAGDCWANRALQSASECRLEFTNIDVADYTQGAEQVRLYDGMNLPLFEHGFDVVFTSFVLHHTHSYKYFLNQLKFLAPWLIVVDDTPKDFRELLNEYAHVYAYEPWKGNPRNGCDVQTLDSLKDTFRECGLTIVSEDVLPDLELGDAYNIHDVTRTSFLLRSDWHSAMQPAGKVR